MLRVGLNVLERWDYMEGVVVREYSTLLSLSILIIDQFEKHRLCLP